jgi:hypothetical protein
MKGSIGRVGLVCILLVGVLDISVTYMRTIGWMFSVLLAFMKS